MLLNAGECKSQNWALPARNQLQPSLHMLPMQVGIGIPELARQTKAEDQRNNPGHTDVLRQSELGASAGVPA